MDQENDAAGLPTVRDSSAWHTVTPDGDAVLKTPNATCERVANFAVPIDAASQAQVRSPSGIPLPDEVRRLLREQVGVYYECWLSNVRVIGLDDRTGVLTLSASGPFVRDWLQNNYADRVMRTWNQARHVTKGPRLHRVEFRTVKL